MEAYDDFVKRLKNAVNGGKFYERGAAALMGLVRSARPVSGPGRFCDDCGLQCDCGVSEVSVGGLRASIRFFSIAGGKESDLCISCAAEFLADAAVKLRGEAG